MTRQQVLIEYATAGSADKTESLQTGIEGLFHAFIRSLGVDARADHVFKLREILDAIRTESVK